MLSFRRCVAASYLRQVDSLSRRQGALLIGGGLFACLVAVFRLVNPGTYPAGDLRSESWFLPLTTLLNLAVAIWFLVPGITRLRRS